MPAQGQGWICGPSRGPSMMNIVSELKAALPPRAVVAGAAIPERHLGDWGVRLPREKQPLAVLYPRSAVDVSSVLRICNTHGCPVVPQGGLTGLTGAATPTNGCIVVSLERMAAVEEIDHAASTMTVQAGVPLESVQKSAREAGFFFPLDLGARGSCRIGGNVATNAGGNRVLRYGMTRELVLGMEVVLADGTVITSLNKMQKNNAGYDLKHFFIGSEGTLGIMTRVVLRLYPLTASTCTALCAVPDYEAAIRLLHHAKAFLGPTLSAFEMMWPDFYALAVDTTGQRPPLSDAHGGYVLLDSQGMDQERDQRQLENMVAQALESGMVRDAVVAQSHREAGDLWALRDITGEFGRVYSPRVDFDISLPIGRIGEFVERCRPALSRRWPAARLIFWGHIADSNLHLSVNLDEKPLPIKAVDTVVYDLVREFGGSISAEHGIGTLKREFLGYSRSEEEIAVMKRIKAALDPAGILNPGKVF